MKVFNLPDLGEGLQDAEVVRWLVAEGDTVSIDQPMVEMETAKAVVEVPSPFAGVIDTLHGQAGDVILVGAPLVTFRGANESASEMTAVCRVCQRLIDFSMSDESLLPRENASTSS